NGDDHVAVRRHAAVFLLANRELYADAYPGQRLDKHVSAALKDAEYGDELDINAIARHYRRDVVVHRMNDLARPRLSLHGDGKTPPMHIAYVNGNHYDAVRYADEGARAPGGLPESPQCMWRRRRPTRPE